MQKNSVSMEQAFNSEAMGFSRPEIVEDFLTQIRIFSWSKNSLILLPLFVFHRFDQGQNYLPVFLAFMAFSLLVSAVSMLSDLKDHSLDVQRATQRSGPIADGRVSRSDAVAWMFGLLTGAAFLSTSLPTSFKVILAVYFIGNVLYTYGINRIGFLDVVWSTGFNMLRILAGCAVLGISISHGVLVFSAFFFFGLAAIGRYARLNRGKQWSLIRRFVAIP